MPTLVDQSDCDRHIQAQGSVPSDWREKAVYLYYIQQHKAISNYCSSKLSYLTTRLIENCSDPVKFMVFDNLLNRLRAVGRGLFKQAFKIIH